MIRMGNFSAKSVLLGSVCLGVLLPSTAAFAQGQNDRAVLEEVIVTAQQREQSLKDVPVSVAVVDGAKLNEQAIARMDDLQFSIPNFTMTETGIGTNVFIRGIGSGINQGFEQSVGLFVDGIHHGRSQQARAPFFDVARVEVLRGPQPILFGKNSVAGAVNIVTARPTQEFEGIVNLGYETIDNEKDGSLILSGPISDKIRVRVAGRYHDLAGYINNKTENRLEPQQEDWTLRGTIEADFSDTFTARLKVERSEFDVLGRNIEVANAVAAAAGPFAGLTYPQILAGVFHQDASVLDATIDGNRHATNDFSNNKQTEVVLTMDWKMGENTLTSTTGYSDFSYKDNCDCDFTGANVFSLPLEEDYEQFSQEFRITSPVGERLNYIVGAYYQNSSHNFYDSLQVNSTSVLVSLLNLKSPGLGNLFANTSGPRTAKVDAEMISGFAQVNYDINQRLTLQLGGRFTNETKEGSRNLTIAALDGSALPAAQAIVADYYAFVFKIGASNALDVVLPVSTIYGTHPVAGKRSESNFTPNIKLQFDASDNAMLYASWVRGRKSGGFDFRANNKGASATMEDAFQFEDELATNYEVGGKFVLNGGVAELNVAAFYTKFDELQVSVFDGTLGFNVGNAAKAQVKGLEVDGRIQATDNLVLNGSVAYTDFKFKEYYNGQCYIGLAPNGPLAANGFCDYSGLTNQLVSDWQGTLGATHTYRLNDRMDIRTSVDMFFTSEYNASAANDPALVQAGYAKINARIALADTDNGWEVAVLGKNLTDKKVILFGGDVPLAGSSFGAKTNYVFMGRGRTVTIQATKRF